MGIGRSGDATGMSDYEKRALKQIHTWKTPQKTWFDQAMSIVSWPLEKAGDFVFDTSVGEIIQKGMSGIIGCLGDAAHWSVRPDAIFEGYRECGYDVNGHEDLLKLDLLDVDKTIGYLAAKYKGLAFAEGAATGLAGLPGIPADVVALISMNQRAIGEYATYCGFDVAVQHERVFAMNLLALASSPADAAKIVVMANLVKIAQDTAKKATWKQLEKNYITQVIKSISKALSIRLTKAKLAQVIPVTGAAIGAGFNTYYTSQVCDAAFYLYRERFLAAKYGAGVIEETVKPAEVIEILTKEEQEEIPKGDE